MRKYRLIEEFARKHKAFFYPAGFGIGHQVMIDEGKKHRPVPIEPQGDLLTRLKAMPGQEHFASRAIPILRSMAA